MVMPWNVMGSLEKGSKETKVSFIQKVMGRNSYCGSGEALKSKKEKKIMGKGGWGEGVWAHTPYIGVSLLDSETLEHAHDLSIYNICT